MQSVRKRPRDVEALGFGFELCVNFVFWGEWSSIDFLKNKVHIELTSEIRSLKLCLTLFIFVVIKLIILECFKRSCCLFS